MDNSLYHLSHSHYISSWVDYLLPKCPNISFLRLLDTVKQKKNCAKTQKNNHPSLCHTSQRFGENCWSVGRNKHSATPQKPPETLQELRQTRRFCEGPLDSTEVNSGAHLMTSGIPHGLRAINKRLEEKGSEEETDSQSAASVFRSSAAGCFIAQCAAVPIFSSCRDYSNQAPASENITSRAYKGED